MITAASGSVLLATESQSRLTDPGFRLQVTKPFDDIEPPLNIAVDVAETRWGFGGHLELRNVRVYSIEGGKTVQPAKALIEHAGFVNEIWVDMSRPFVDAVYKKTGAKTSNFSNVDVLCEVLASDHVEHTSRLTGVKRWIGEVSLPLEVRITFSENGKTLHTIQQITARGFWTPSDDIAHAVLGTGR